MLGGGIELDDGKIAGRVAGENGSRLPHAAKVQRERVAVICWHWEIRPPVCTIVMTTAIPHVNAPNMYATSAMPGCTFTDGE